MPRRTPVRELQDENAEGSLRRSSRIAQSSPGPASMTKRRNSSSSDTPVKITKGRRLSLSQENNSSTENKSLSETNVTDTSERITSTHSISKSPTLSAKNLETRGAPASTRTRRGSKTLDEDDTSSESSLQRGRGRSTRSESKSPITIRDVEPAKTRTRRGSITERVVPLEKIEEAHPSTPEPKKRTRGRRSSLTEMSQLDVIEEAQVIKNDIKNSELETIAETKENDEKDRSLISDSSDCNEKPTAGQEKDKFRMSPVVVIQKSKVIADLTSQNSEKETVAEVKNIKDDMIEVKGKTENDYKTDKDDIDKLCPPKQNESENNVNDRNSDLKMDTEHVTEENAKVENEVSSPSSSSDPLINLDNSSPKMEVKSITEGTKVEADVPIVCNKLEHSTNSDSTIKKIQNSYTKEENKPIPENDTKMEQELPTVSSDLESPSSDSTNKKNQNSDFQKQEGNSNAEIDAKIEEELPIISSKLEPSIISDSANKKSQNFDFKEKEDNAGDKKEELPFTSSNLEPPTNSDSNNKEVTSNAKENIKIDEKCPVTSTVLKPLTSSNSAIGKTQNCQNEGKDDAEENTKMVETPIISSNLERSTNADNCAKMQNSDSEKADKSITKQDTKTEKLLIVSNNSDSEKADKSISKQDTKTEKLLIVSNNLESSVNLDSSEKKINSNSEGTPAYKNKMQRIEDKNEISDNQIKGAFPSDILPINKIDINKIEKVNVNEKKQDIPKKLSPEDEVILKNIDTVLNADTSVDQNEPELDKAKISSENVLSVSGGKDLDLDIDVERMSADALTKPLNEINQSTPMKDDLKKTYIQISDRELSTFKNVSKEVSLNSKISSQDLLNKSLSTLLCNQVEMTSGSDGSFDIKLSLQDVEGSSNQEDLGDCQRSKSNVLNESDDDLNKRDSSNKENLINEQNKNVTAESEPVSERNILGNISLEEIEKNPEVVKKQANYNFCEPMDVDDPSLLLVDDILAMNKKRRSLDTQSLSLSNKKICISPTSPMKKESITILDIQKSTENPENDSCKTSDTQHKINTVISNENEQTFNKCDISENDLNISKAMNFNLEKDRLNKTDESHSQQTGEPNQIHLKESDVEQTALNTSEADNSENTNGNIQQQCKENTTESTEDGDLINDSVNVDDKDNENECLSPTFSINSADITDEENDEVDIVKDSPMKPSDKGIENTLKTADGENIERQTIDVSNVMENPATEKMADDIDPGTSTKTHSSINNDEKLPLSQAQETENSIAKEYQNKISEYDTDKLIDADSKCHSNSSKAASIELANSDLEPPTDTPQNKLEDKTKTDNSQLPSDIQLVSRKSIENMDSNDRSTEQVSSTTSNEIKLKEHKTDKNSETVNITEANVKNTSGSSNEDVNKESLKKGDDEINDESNDDCSSQIATESNVTLSIKKKDTDRDHLRDATNISPKQQKVEHTKLKSQKKTKVEVKESVEIDHSAEEVNENSVSELLKEKKKTKKKNASKSSLDSSFEEIVEDFIEETVKNTTISSEDEDNIEEESSNVFIDDMAEEGEEDTPSEGSNDIPCDGESINSSDTYTEDNDDYSYESDSFIDDDNDKDELLSGEETFLQDVQPSDLEKTEAKQKAKSPQKQKKKRQRIINISESDDEATNRSEEDNVEEITHNEEAEKGEEDIQIDSKLIAENNDEKSREDSPEDGIDSNRKEIDVDAPTDFLPSKNDVIHVDSDSSESETLHSADQAELNERASGPVENRSNRKSSITIQENIKLEDIEDGELSDRISKVVDWFYTGIRNNSDTGNISLNVSLDYADLPPNEQNADEDVDTNVKFEELETSSGNRKSKKRKSDDFVGSESPKRVTYETIVDEVFGDEAESTKEYTKLKKPKLSKKKKRKSLQKESPKDEILNEQHTSAECTLVSGKSRKKHSRKFEVTENLNENQLEPDFKKTSKRLSDDQLNYLSPKRVKHHGADKTGKTSKVINKDNIEDDFPDEVFNENEIIETGIVRDKPKKIRKNKKVEQVCDVIGKVISTNIVKKKTKKVKDSGEDNTNMNNFHDVPSKIVNQLGPFSRNTSKLNDDFNIEIENKKSKKLKRLSYPTKKTDIPCTSGILKKKFVPITMASKSEVVQKLGKRKNLVQKASRRVLPSQDTDPNDSWESEAFDMSLHPSKSNRKYIDAGTLKKKTEIDSFSSKDFKNRMLYDSSRIKRMSSKVLLRKHKGL